MWIYLRHPGRHFGLLSIDPQTEDPLIVRGNLEITSVVARTEATRLCLCVASGNKPFCDNSHAKIGFKFV